jgi:hypothetical protein
MKLEAVWTLQCRFTLTKLHGVVYIISEELTASVVDVDNASFLQMEAAGFTIMLATMMHETAV